MAGITVFNFGGGLGLGGVRGLNCAALILIGGDDDVFFGFLTLSLSKSRAVAWSELIFNPPGVTGRSGRSIPSRMATYSANVWHLIRILG